MSLHKQFLLLMLTILLWACSQPLPADRRHYVGQWHGDGMTLAIGADGQVAYKRSKGSSSTSINAPLQKFEGDDFFVGVGPIGTRFKVDEPPAQIDGEWRMTVDGVDLVRHGEPEHLDASGRPLTPA